MARHTPTIACIALVFAFAAGCGDDDARDAAKTKPKPKPNPAKVDLARFLMRTGEEPGYAPAESPRVDTSVEPFELSADGVGRLRRSGFVSTTYQPIHAENGNAGVNVVHLFKTGAGARAWIKYETSTERIHDQVPGSKVRRFAVPGIPHARGYTGPDRHDHPTGYIFWVQGRCMLALANEGKGDLVKPLLAGAKAIHERTNGVCP